MIREAVKSSAIDQVGYDPATQRLEVVFSADKYGARSVYAFEGVPSDEHYAFVNAESMGRKLRDLQANHGAVRIATIDVDGVERPVEAAE